MPLERRSLSIACLFIALGWTGPSQALYYSLLGGSGEEFQFGRGRLEPQALTTTGGTGGWVPPSWTGTMFPPLLIPPNADPAKALIQQTAGPDPKRMTIPPGAFRRPAPGPTLVGVALKEPQFFQVRTNLEFSGPAPAFGSAVLEAGGRTGAAVATFVGTPASSKIRYTKTVNQFGGPSQTRVVAATPVHAWAHVLSVMAPCQHPVFGGDAMDPNDAGYVAVLFAEYPDPLVAAGAAVGFTAMTPGGPQPSPNVFFASVPNATGLLAMSAPVPGPPPTNRATSAGFPWTTGMVTVSQPGALGGAEKFVITGNDTRGMSGNNPGEGTISLVSGALSTRFGSGAEANRGWARFTLPEPGAAPRLRSRR